MKLKQDELPIINNFVAYSDAGAQQMHIHYDPKVFVAKDAAINPARQGLGSGPSHWIPGLYRAPSLAANEPIFSNHTPIAVRRQIVIEISAGTWDLVLDYTPVLGNMVDSDRLSELAKSRMEREPPAGESYFIMNKRPLMGVT